MAKQPEWTINNASPPSTSLRLWARSANRTTDILNLDRLLATKGNSAHLSVFMNRHIIRNISATVLTTIMPGVALVPAHAQELKGKQLIDYVHQCEQMNSQQVLRSTGDPKMAFCAGYFYDSGTRGVRQDESKAVTYYRTAAEAGYAVAQLELAEHYAQGQGVQQNYAEALKWWHQAAQQNFAGAQNDLGAAYQNGLGVAKDLNMAKTWYRAAAANGSAMAANNLSALIAPKRTEPAEDIREQAVASYKDKPKYIRLMRTAAQAGNSIALYGLGWSYLHGEDGLPQDSAEAAKWYSKSASLGNPEAQATLGLLYEEGNGVPEDWVKAAQLYHQSAEQNNAIGQSMLARAYEFGIGVPQNRALALDWDRRAAANGNSQSAYFAKWLSDPSNNIGFRNAQERNMFPALPDNLIFEPKGQTFHNSSERAAFLRAERRDYDQREADNAQRARYCESGKCASSKSEWESKYGPH